MNSPINHPAEGDQNATEGKPARKDLRQTTKKAPTGQKRAMRKIGGIPLRLTVGRRYVASRPMAEFGDNGRYPVTIKSVGKRGKPEVVELGMMSYDHANRFMALFNSNPKNSWSGRVWR